MGASKVNGLAFLVGRLMVGGMYLSAGLTNLIELDGKAGYAASKGLPDARVWVTLASLLLVAAGVSLLTGIRPRLGVGAVALFLIPVTAIIHNFWAVEGVQQISELRSFMSNLALLGSAMMLLAIPRPWPLSLDGLVNAIGDRIRRATGAAPRQPSLHSKR